MSQRVEHASSRHGVEGLEHGRFALSFFKVYAEGLTVGMAHFCYECHGFVLSERGGGHYVERYLRVRFRVQARHRYLLR